MIYRLQDLLIKMGAPDVSEKRQIEWHYFDKNKADLAGFAEIRFENDGAILVAELKRTRENYEDDHGAIHAQYVESFHMSAERVGSGTRYRVTKISFDGDVYAHPTTGIIELGLSIFHARALDISIRMVEQAFNRDDILSPPVIGEEAPRPSHMTSFVKRAAEQQSAVILPFKKRAV